MRKLIINAVTGEQLEVDCKYYRDNDWVVLFLADFETVPPGFYEFDPEVDIKPDPQGELDWVALEMAVVADQLLKLEDEDPSALPGTARQWRDYRIALRAWNATNPIFPNRLFRPERPK